MPHFTILDSEKKYAGKIIDLTVDRLRYDSGVESIREIVEHPGGAVAAGMFDNGDIVLISQYRHPFSKEVIELPAGKLERNENPLHCAQRELREETGYIARSWTNMTSIMTTPGFCNEMLHLYLATGLSPSKEGQALEEGEKTIKVMRTPMKEALAMIADERIVDAKTIIGILLADRAGRV